MRYIGSKNAVKRRQGNKIIGWVPVVIFGVQTDQKRKASFRLHKRLPNGCKTPKRICVVCLKNSINKNDSNYETKICKDCS